MMRKMQEYSKKDIKKPLTINDFRGFVPSAGIEPAHLAVLEFESSASTNSANWARNWVCKYRFFFNSEKLFI